MTYPKKTLIAASVLMLAISLLAISLLASSCGSTTTTTAASPETTLASPETTVVSPETTVDSPAAAAETILGHAPTGLAKQIVDRGKVIVADDANYPPQSLLKEDGTLVGFDVDVAKRVAELLGLEVQFVNPAWDSIPTGLQVGRFDVSIGSMSPTPDRRESVDFADPYALSAAVIMTKAGTAGLNTVAELDGKKIATGAATSYYTWLQTNTKAVIKSYESSLDAFPDLEMGRVDGVMTAAPSAQEAIAAGKPFQLTGKPFMYEDICFAIKKAEPDWLALLNYTVKTMHADGSLTAMSEQWYNGLDVTSKK